MQITLQQLEDALVAYDDEKVGFGFLSTFFRASCIDQLHDLVSEYKKKAPDNKNLDVACLLAMMKILAQQYADDKNKQAVAFIKQKISALNSLAVTYATLAENKLLGFIRGRKNHYFAAGVQSALTLMLEEPNRLTPANFELLLNISPQDALCRYDIAKLVVELDKQGLLTKEYSDSLIASVQENSRHLDSITEAYFQNGKAVGPFIPALLLHAAPARVIPVIHMIHHLDASHLESHSELRLKLFALKDSELISLHDQLLSCPDESKLERLAILIQEPGLYLGDIIAPEMRRLPPGENSDECFKVIQAILAANADDLKAAKRELVTHLNEVSQKMREESRRNRRLKLVAPEDNTEAQISLNLFSGESNAGTTAVSMLGDLLQAGVSFRQ